MSEDSINLEVASRAELVRVLKQFPLTYEQHQVLDKPGIELLVQQLLRKRGRFTIGLSVLAATCSAFAIQGIASSSIYLPWILVASLLGYWSYRRIRRSNSLRETFHRFEQSRLGQTDQQISLGDALRLSFSLDYDEHQAIHHGDDQLVADRMIDRLNKNSATLALGAAGVALLTWNRAGLQSWPFIIVLAVGVAACSCRNWLQIRRVKRIVGEHAESTIDSGEDPLHVLAEAFGDEEQATSSMPS